MNKIVIFPTVLSKPKGLIIFFCHTDCMPNKQGGCVKYSLCTIEEDFTQQMKCSLIM